MELIGSYGRPKHTLAALRDALKGAHWPKLQVTLVTTWQGERKALPYAIFIEGYKTPILTQPAFGGAFGDEGRTALAELVRWLSAQGVRHFYEAVLEPGRFTELTSTDPEAVATLTAIRNPADPWIWRAA